MGSLQTTIQWAGPKNGPPNNADKWIPYVYPVLFAWPTAALMFCLWPTIGMGGWLRIINVRLAVEYCLVGLPYLLISDLWYAVETVEADIPITQRSAFMSSHYYLIVL